MCIVGALLAVAGTASGCQWRAARRSVYRSALANHIVGGAPQLRADAQSSHSHLASGSPGAWAGRVGIMGAAALGRRPDRGCSETISECLRGRPPPPRSRKRGRPRSRSAATLPRVAARSLKRGERGGAARQAPSPVQRCLRRQLAAGRPVAGRLTRARAPAPAARLPPCWRRRAAWSRRPGGRRGGCLLLISAG